MATDIDLTQLDRRLVERLVKKGQLSDKEWDKYLKTLPDLADQAEAMETRFESLSGEDED
jgi:hypothetical protein